ncbi:MAG: 2-oxo acid dehydrogenase subunit E2 [Holosporaceae bacterium]|jgi:pyruvate/2-oxoglutarate dehydrogenase complex dihydrolipoamide acyltransferase (E2) component|nr:2-oxo acid dehydrogenase subunit E2 [Holosporaceae bacterium]
MKVDIIVPNFDKTSDEVTLSSWYKKVGEKISKNEIIADAETISVACGITSSYDCILAKILVKEGEVISQGTKIAVIETDLNADLSEIVRDIERKETEKVSQAIDSQIQQEARQAKVMREEIKEQLGEKLEKVLERRGEVTSKGYSLSIPLEGEEIASQMVEAVAEEFAEQSEEKFLHILKNTEKQAKEEALKLREKILTEAQVQAKIQAEELKEKILKEYEDKATKDAAEMHQTIVQGSLQEAEKTKAKLIEEAREKALQEATELKRNVLTLAEKEAKREAETTIKKAIFCAEEGAKQKAELLSKEIIEQAIEESKTEAKAIKKDIIHSARKHAAKESVDIVREALKDAKAKSYLQTEEILESTTQLAAREAESLKDEIIKNTNEEIRTVMNSMLHSVAQELKREIGVDIHKTVSEVDREKVGALRRRDKREDFYPRAHSKDKVHHEVGYCADEQEEIVRKLLHESSQNGPPEVYADNWNRPQFFESPGDRNEPIDMLRQRISDRMRDSYDASVISTVSNEVDMSAVLTLEKTFGKAFAKKHNTRLGFTPFFISACIAALKQYRIFNAHIRNGEIIYKNTFDISIITCGNDGIAAPVIRHADALSIAEIERSMISLSRRAMEGILSIEEVSGGTFTVINAGIYGSLIGTDLLTPPQVATLSVHKMHNRPIATGNGMEIKPMLYISLSYDHRVSDTRQASEFLSNIKNYVENPGWQILGLN